MWISSEAAPGGASPAASAHSVAGSGALGFGAGI